MSVVVTLVSIGGAGHSLCGRHAASLELTTATSGYPTLSQIQQRAVSIATDITQFLYIFSGINRPINRAHIIFQVKNELPKDLIFYIESENPSEYFNLRRSCWLPKAAEHCSEWICDGVNWDSSRLQCEAKPQYFELF